METSLQTMYDSTLNAHIATLHPPLAAVEITVRIDGFEASSGIDELFLYNFDVDSNCIEFAFKEKNQQLWETREVTYSTDPNVHVPPFRIQITHQRPEADLSAYAFTVSYQLRF